MFLRSLRQLTTLTRPVVLAGLILLAAPAAYGQGGLVAPAGVEVTPMSLTLDESATVKRLGPYDAEPNFEKLGDPTLKATTPGWTLIFSDGIENAWPGPWNVFDQDPASGTDFWGDVSCRSLTGAWSAWCADISNTDCTSYDNDMKSWMIFGPFSLANAQDAQATLAAWSEVEDGFDSLAILASINGTNFFGAGISQDFGWSGFSFDLTNVNTLGDLTGQPNVWLAFVFDSDASAAFDEGVYLDDIIIEKLVVGGGCTPSATTLCLPADNRFRVTLSFFTTQGAGNSGNAQAIPLDSLGTSAGGLFYFTNATDPQMLVKIVNGCAVNNRYWVFFAATTNVGFDLTVTDTATNTTRVYSNPDINPAPPVQDTQAFATCP